MFRSPRVLKRSLRILCVQSVQATSVLQPALKTGCVGEPESEGAASRCLWHLFVLSVS